MINNLQEIRHDFHHLIDQFDNEKLLSQIYLLLKDYKEENKDEDFWDSLTEDQKHDLELAWVESENEVNLIKHSVVMREAKTWLM